MDPYRKRWPLVPMSYTQSTASAKHLPWWTTCPAQGFTAEAWKRAPQMSNSPEGRRTASVQGLQEIKSGKTRSAIRLDH